MAESQHVCTTVVGAAMQAAGLECSFDSQSTTLTIRVNMRPWSCSLKGLLGRQSLSAGLYHLLQLFLVLPFAHLKVNIFLLRSSPVVNACHRHAAKPIEGSLQHPTQLAEWHVALADPAYYAALHTGRPVTKALPLIS